MQLKRYNALTTRTVHRPTRGETANEVTASRFSVDPATEVFQSPPLALQQTGGRGITIWRAGEGDNATTWTEKQFVCLPSRSFFPLASCRHRFSRLSVSSVQPVQKPRPNGWLEGERERERRVFSSIYVSWKNVSFSSVSWITVLTTLFYDCAFPFLSCFCQ